LSSVLLELFLVHKLIEADVFQSEQFFELHIFLSVFQTKLVSIWLCSFHFCAALFTSCCTFVSQV